MTHAKSIVAGNWKMNGLNNSITELKALADLVKTGPAANCEILICPPYTLLQSFCQQTAAPIMIGAQDCHANASGAHTGDVSAEMIKDCGATHVIVGHSERRADHGEASSAVAAKVEAAVRSGLIAIICVGETESERDKGQTLPVVLEQLSASIPDGVESSSFIIAYEPVWAIGTGRTPTAEDVAEVHAAIRGALVERFSDAGNSISILYGGSVKPSNADELMNVENVNGALVGGASLKALDFNGIINAYRK